MFEARHIKNKTSNYVEVKNPDKQAYAKIDLDLGGSLQELILDGQTIISSRETLPYEESYASAILFPFANRMENGKYDYDGKTYQLQINKPEENNAIHGLVYDKPFEVVHISCNKNESAIHVRYVENGEPLGFPFKYMLTASYTLSKNSIELMVEVKNMDEFSFPFTIGWHPYFASSNLSECILNIECSKKILVNAQRIPTHETPVEFPKNLPIGNKELDDCFILNTKELCFKTAEYKLKFSFSPNENYLQLYIPPNRRTIAIEPQSGAANNFNDHRGLKILHPHELFETRWKIEVNATKLNTVQ